MPINAATDLIWGTWKVEFTATGMILRREPFHPIESTLWEYGHRFDIQENGKFVDSYTAPCGNDEFIHHWTGNWKLDEDERTLILQIENYPVRDRNEKLRPSEAYKKGQEFHIIEIAKEEMHLQVKGPEVQWVTAPLWKYERQEC